MLPSDRPLSCLTLRIRRLIGGSLAAVLLAQAGLADAAATSVWGDRHQSITPKPALPDTTALASALNTRLKTDGTRLYSSLVPPSQGTIRVAAPRTGARRGSVLLVQDVHLNLEAQKNISKAIGNLTNGHVVNLVAVEGSARAMPIAAFHESPDLESLKLAADFLLSKGQISGAAHAALIAKSNARVEGIDDKRLHAENVAAYRAAGADLSRFQSAIATEKARVDGEKATAYNAALLAFDAAVSDRRSEKASFHDYLTALTSRAALLKIEVPANLTAFAEAATLEKSLNIGLVEKERSAILSKLAAHLSAEDATGLLRAGVAFRAGEMDHVDFYRAFMAYCKKAGLSDGKTPELQKYVRYLALADSIDGGAAMNGADVLERTIYDQLARTDAERALIEADRAVYLAGKLSRFSLTRSEWAAWSRAHRDFAGSRSFEQFYAVAARRDDALADNLLAQLDGDKAPAAVAVVGGFHAPQLANRLGAAGYDVALFTPALTHVDGDGSAYLSVFSRDKTPLEGLFEGQKLFLAADAMSDAAAVSLFTLTSARAFVLGRAGDFASFARRALGLTLKDRRSVDGGVRHVFTGNDGRDRAVDVEGVSVTGFRALPLTGRLSSRARISQFISKVLKRFAKIIEPAPLTASEPFLGLVRRHFSAQDQISFVDLESGTGAFVAKFKKLLSGSFKQVEGVGIDTVTSYAEEVGNKVLFGMPDVPGDYEKAGLTDASRDIVTINAIESNVAALMDQAARIVKPDGMIIVTFEAYDIPEGYRVDLAAKNRLKELGFAVQEQKFPNDYPRSESFAQYDELILVATREKVPGNEAAVQPSVSNAPTIPEASTPATMIKNLKAGWRAAAREIRKTLDPLRFIFSDHTNSEFLGWQKRAIGLGTIYAAMIFIPFQIGLLMASNTSLGTIAIMLISVALIPVANVASHGIVNTFWAVVSPLHGLLLRLSIQTENLMARHTAGFAASMFEPAPLVLGTFGPSEKPGTSSYAERLRTYLAALSGAPDTFDTTTTAYQLIASETTELLRDVSRHPTLIEAWYPVLQHYRVPFEDFLNAAFQSWTQRDPHHVIEPVSNLIKTMARQPERDAFGPLITFVTRVFASALQDIFLRGRDELWARDSEPLRILEVTPEVRPFSKAGGMGVVNGELPNELNRFHAWATTVSLYYDDGNYDLDGEGSPFTRKQKMPFELKITIGGEAHVAEVYQVRRRNDDGTYAAFYFLKDTYLNPGNLTKSLYPSERGLQQAVFLSEGSLQLMKELHKTGQKNFDVLRAHDWVAGLAPVFLKTRTYPEDSEMREALKGVHPMAFLHNLEPGYKGAFSVKDWPLLGLDESHKQAFGWTSVTNGPDFSHQLHGFAENEMSIVKALTHHAEGLFVPSPTYGKLIQSEKYGYEMASMFRARDHILTGILNGTEYDPKDELLFPMGRRPVDDFLKNQAQAKLLILKESGLYEKIEEEVRARLLARAGHVDKAAFDAEMEIEIDRPILGAVVRLDPKMKGVWFFHSLGERLTREDTPRPIRIILLGSPLNGPNRKGDEDGKITPFTESEIFVKKMTELAASKPANIAFFPVGRKALSKAGAAAAKRINVGKKIETFNDALQAAVWGLYPSSVEPGGLADVESMALGAPVIVSDKGGFKDKARDWRDTTTTDRDVTGAVFTGDYTDHEGMIRLVEDFVNFYYDHREEFNRIAVNNKNRRFTMTTMARAHVVAIAKAVGRNDIAVTPEKPVHRPTAKSDATEDEDGIMSDERGAPPPTAFKSNPLYARALSRVAGDYTRALAELERELNGTDAEAQSLAIQILSDVAREHPVRITQTVVQKLTDMLTRSALRTNDLPQAAIIFLNRLNFTTPETLRGIENAIAAGNLPPVTLSNMLEALSVIGNARAEWITPVTIATIETVMRTEGSRPALYNLAAKTLKIFLERRKDLAVPGSFIATVLAMPESMQRQPWSHFELFKLNPFPEKMSLHEKYTVGLLAYRLLNRLGIPLNVKSATDAVNTILRVRRERSSRVVLGPEYSVITVTHQQDRFLNSDAVLMAIRAGVPGEQVLKDYKGTSEKAEILQSFSRVRGKLALIFDGHGGSNHLWLDKSLDDQSDLLTDAHGISYKELGDALLESIKVTGNRDLSRISFFLNACFSYDFSERLLDYLAAAGVTALPVMIAPANKNREAYGRVEDRRAVDNLRRPVTLGDIFDAEKYGFDQEKFTDFVVFDAADSRVSRDLGSDKQLPYLEIGLASPTAFVLRFLGLKNGALIASIGGALESLFILAAIPGIFFALGLPADSILTLVKLLVFPAIHLFGAMTPVKDADGNVRLQISRPSAGRLFRLFMLGGLIHAVLPSEIGLTAHLLLNLALAVTARPETNEESLARNVAAAAQERVRNGVAGAAWESAMESLVNGRAARVGVTQFGGAGNVTLSNIDEEDFDGDAFKSALRRDLEENKLRASLSPSVAYETAKDVALAGIASESLEAAVARLSPTETNLIIAETLTEEEIPALAAQLRANSGVRATLIIKDGSERSAAVAKVLGALGNVTVTADDRVVSADGERSRVSMARLDALLKASGFSGGRIHVWAGKNVLFDSEGLAQDSAIREALITILDAMSVTASFQRMDLLDTMYRLMSSQA